MTDWNVGAVARVREPAREAIELVHAEHPKASPGSRRCSLARDHKFNLRTRSSSDSRLMASEFNCNRLVDTDTTTTTTSSSMSAICKLQNA